MRFLEFNVRGKPTFFREDLVRRVEMKEKADSDGDTGKVIYDGVDNFYIRNTIEEVREILNGPAPGSENSDQSVVTIQTRPPGNLPLDCPAERNPLWIQMISAETAIALARDKDWLEQTLRVRGSPWQEAKVRSVHVAGAYMSYLFVGRYLGCYYVYSLDTDIRDWEKVFNVRTVQIQGDE